jgi:hypothetical protein
MKYAVETNSGAMIYIYIYIYTHQGSLRLVQTKKIYRMGIHRHTENMVISKAYFHHQNNNINNNNNNSNNNIELI